MRYEVIRKHEFHTGHRVYLHESKCQNLHGHSYIAHLVCSSNDNNLDNIGRVIDFSVIKQVVCSWIDEFFDHRFLVWDQDPLSDKLQQIDEKVQIVDFNPTAENMGAFIIKIANDLLKDYGVSLNKIILEETGKCRAEVYNDTLL